MNEQGEKQYYLLKDDGPGAYLVEERGGTHTQYGSFFIVAYRRSKKGSWFRTKSERHVKYWTFLHRMRVEIDESDALAILLMAKLSTSDL